jgi:hypothetical protein
MSHENNHPTGGNSPNQVTKVQAGVHKRFNNRKSTPFRGKNATAENLQ